MEPPQMSVKKVWFIKFRNSYFYFNFQLPYSSCNDRGIYYKYANSGPSYNKYWRNIWGDKYLLNQINAML